MTRYSPPAAPGGVGILLLTLALCACTSAAPPGPPAPARPTRTPAPVPSPLSPTATATPAVHTGFVGYRWTVTAIAHGGQKAEIPAGLAVYLMFFRGGQFVGNEPFNTECPGDSVF